MSNLFHPLIETPSGNLSEIMRHINGAYTAHFNVKRRRAGHLLQDRYNSILAKMEECAEELSPCIH